MAGTGNNKTRIEHDMQQPLRRSAHEHLHIVLLLLIWPFPAPAAAGFAVAKIEHRTRSLPSKRYLLTASHALVLAWPSMPAICPTRRSLHD